MRFAQPLRHEFRPEVYEKKDSSRFDQRNDSIDQLECTGIDPVCVRENNNERLFVREPQEMST